MRTILAATAIVLVSSAAAEEKRGLDAHEHGVGLLNIAIEGTSVAIELEAPGADIVGFEHAAESDEDRAAIKSAKAKLSEPLTIFAMPAAAGCSATSVEVELLTDDEEHGDHAGHGHGEEHAGHGHGEEHAGHGHGEEHAGHGHGEEHAAHDKHHGDEHAEASHTEFHAAYVLDCADPGRLDRIDFAYFDQFPNARELEVQMIGANGTAGFEVERDDPVLEIPGNI